MSSRFGNPICAAIICKNEAELIGGCLESLDFCAEIVVVDSGSTDGTIEIVERYRSQGFPIRLLHQEWLGYAAQKQFALDQATQPWLLVVDADEQVDDTLKRSIAATVEADEPAFSAWYMRRRDWLTGYGFAHPWVAHNRMLRLMRAGKARVDTSRTIHESFIIEGATGAIRQGELLHRRDLSIDDDIARANRYATEKCRMRLAEGKRSSTWRLAIVPSYTFLKFYLLKRYFLCGRPGLIYARIMMIYSFLTEAKSYRASVDTSDTAP